jgi:hypothetical protein
MNLGALASRRRVAVGIVEMNLAAMAPAKKMTNSTRRQSWSLG